MTYEDCVMVKLKKSKTKRYKALQVNKDQKISRVSLGGCQATRWLLWI